MRVYQCAPLTIAAGLMTILSVTACQPLSRPFVHDDGLNQTILRIPDGAGIYVETSVDIEPHLVTDIVSALHQADIVATHGLVRNPTSFVLTPEFTDETIIWVLLSPEGQEIARRSEAGTDGAALARVAEAMANIVTDDGIRRNFGGGQVGLPETTSPPAPNLGQVIANLIEDGHDNEPSPEDIGPADIEEMQVSADIAPDAAVSDNSVPAENTIGLAVYIAPVEGATGTGNDELTDAMSAVLGQTDEIILVDETSEALVIRGHVDIGPPIGGTQSVAIVWRLYDQNGAEIGAIDQANRVPQGSLDSSWGGAARQIALAASVGLGELLTQALSPTPD